MDFEEKVGQQLMIGISGTEIDAATARQLTHVKPGFIILFSRNIVSATQVAELIAGLKQSVSPPPLIAIDQEGGRVIRFVRDITVFPGNMALGAAGSADLAFKQGVASAVQLKALGIDINLAPVIDVLAATDNPALGTRSFGDNPEKVSELALAFTRGTRMAGIAAVAKHFPGLGAARIDPHRDLPSVALAEPEFEAIHRLPFRRVMADEINGIMSTHLHCPGLDHNGTVPATFSPTVIDDYIRRRCGYQGLIFSDDLEMGAITKYCRIEEACPRATAAGHDVLLICHDYGSQSAGLHALCEAYAGSALSEERLEQSLIRIAALRRFCASRPSPPHPAPPEAEKVAEGIARRAVTLIAEGRCALPLDGSATAAIHLVIPDLVALQPLENGYEPSRTHPIVRACQEHCRGNCYFHFFPRNPRAEEIERIIASLNGSCPCIIFLSDARGNPGQQALIARICASCRMPMFVLLDNPFDYSLIPTGETCLTAYGLRTVQIRALAQVIFGKAEARGTLPFHIQP